MSNKNIHVITTKLEGFISLVPSGKFNNCRIGFTLSDEDFDKFEAEYEKAKVWGANQLKGKRIGYEPQPWSEDGVIKYSYGNPDPGPDDSKKPSFLWVVGPDNLPFDLSTPVREGTKVQLACRLKPYVFGSKVGLSVRIVAGKILEVVSQGGNVDEPLGVDEVADIFGTSGSAAPIPDNDDIPF